MKLWSRVRSWAAANFRRNRLESEMDAELRFHLDAFTEDLMRQGITPTEARCRARLEFGAIEGAKEECREARGAGLTDAIFRDLRFALRTLRKSPGFTAVAVLTLALGIGANTAIFTVISAVLLRPLPFPHSSQLLDISATSARFDFERLNVSWPDLTDIRSSAESLAVVTPYQYATSELSGTGSPERVEVADITEGFFPTLEIAPSLGRNFTSADVQPGSRSVLLGDRLWRQRFGADPATVGKTIMLDGAPHMIVGVMPPLPRTGFSTDDDLWMPMVPSDDQRSTRKSRDFSLLARLKPGHTFTQAQKELETIGARLAAQYPDSNKGWSLHATSMENFVLGDSRSPLLILFCAVGLVLLIACANVSNLFLSRGLARRREFAIRTALGATRAAILRQLFVESVLVAFAGGICALLVATWTSRAFPALMPDIPRAQEIGVRADVVAFTLGLSFLSAILSGLAPSLLISRRDISVAVKESAAGAFSSFGHHNVWRRLLAAGEVGLAVVLLIGATLATQSFARLMRVKLGFRPDHLVTMRVEFPEFRFAKAEQGIAFVQEVLEGSRGVPGVESASAGLVFPLGDYVAETTFQTEQSASNTPAEEQSALNNRVAPDFFRTFGIPLLCGRDFDDDDRRGKAPVFIVNETMARKYFGSIDVVGKRMFTRKEKGQPQWGEIVGVAGNVREVRPGAEQRVQIYEPFAQSRMISGIFLAVRTKADPLRIVPAIQDRVWAIDRNRPVVMIKTLEQQISEDFAQPRSQSLLLSLFSGLGFFLALIGVYGVMFYLVSQQTREIGIRMALGAESGTILRSVIGHGLKLTLAGVAIGLLVSFALTRFLSTLLFGISPTDPATFAGVPVVLTFVTIAASFIPARRATRVDPLAALRHE
jgi:putative ABC transport system permease protein